MTSPRQTAGRGESLTASVHNALTTSLYPALSSTSKWVFSSYFTMPFTYSGSLQIIESRFASQEMQKYFI